jgi:cell division protein FtsQ
MSDSELSTQANSDNQGVKSSTSTDIMAAESHAVQKTPFLIGFPIFLVVVASLIYGTVLAYQWLQDEQRLPVQDIVISGELTMLDVNQLKSIVRNQAKGSFFALDVDHVHRLMILQPWVYTASVRKRWPSKLYIHIFEQQVVAKWNGDLLLNRYGDTFEGLNSKQQKFDALQSAKLLKLPQLFGPMGSEKIALTGYTYMQKLLNISSQKITLLWLSERFAWQAKLNNQVVLKLGRQEYINRLQRYIDVYPLLRQNKKSVAYVDLRYDTGLAVGWGALRNGNELGARTSNKKNS